MSLHRLFTLCVSQFFPPTSTCRDPHKHLMCSPKYAAFGSVLFPLINAIGQIESFILTSSPHPHRFHFPQNKIRSHLITSTTQYWHVRIIASVALFTTLFALRSVAIFGRINSESEWPILWETTRCHSNSGTTYGLTERGREGETFNAIGMWFLLSSCFVWLWFDSIRAFEYSTETRGNFMLMNS